MYHPDHDIAMRVVYEILRHEQTWPVVPYVEAELTRRGAHDTANCLSSAPPHLLRAKRPHDPSSPVLLTVRGLASIDRSSPELFGLVRVLRRCADFFDVHALSSPSNARPAIVVASEQLLWPVTAVVSRAELMSIGLLLEVEGVAQIERLGQLSPAPWHGHLRPVIRDFARVASLDDLLEILAARDVPDDYGLT